MKTKTEDIRVLVTEFVKDAVFPPVCPVCGDVIPVEKRLRHYTAMTGAGKMAPESYICKECISELSYIEKNCCEKCGRPLNDEKDGLLYCGNEKNKDRRNVFGDDLYAAACAGRRLCESCAGGGKPFEKIRSVFIYDDLMKDILSGLKYRSKKEYADMLAVLAYERYGAWIKEISPDMIVPVPVHEKRMRARGYNQAEVIAERLALETGIPMYGNVLARSKNTAAQKELNRTERFRNLRNAFCTNMRLKNAPTVLLVDDIYTTGATMDACTNVLLSAGAGRVYGLCLASGYGNAGKKL